MDKNHLLVYLTWSISMSYLFLYLKLVLSKVVIMWFTSGSWTFKIPKNYDLISSNTKFFYRFDCKMGRKLSQVMSFECFMSLTHRNYAICMYRWKGWWKCFKMLWYLKIQEDYNTFIIFETFKQTVTLHTIFSLSLTIKPFSCCIFFSSEISSFKKAILTSTWCTLKSSWLQL